MSGIKQSQSHYVEKFDSRHLGATMEVWCPEVDETMAIFSSSYFRCCPMCGQSIDTDMEGSDR